MKYDPKIHHRRSIRLKGYDYSSGGLYHIVVRTRNGVCVFGRISENEMKLSPIGEIAQSSWLEIPQHFKNVTLDISQVMPNHVHGILILHEKPPALVRVEYIQPIRGKARPETKNEFQHVVPKSVGSIVRSFKAAVTRICRRRGPSEFAWQRDFYDHVIRDGKDLDRIRRYIIDNPANWANDDDHPKNMRMDRMHVGDEDWSALD
jgi:putative transposase